MDIFHLLLLIAFSAVLVSITLMIILSVRNKKIRKTVDENGIVTIYISYAMIVLLAGIFFALTVFCLSAGLMSLLDSPKQSVGFYILSILFFIATIFGTYIFLIIVTKGKKLIQVKIDKNGIAYYPASFLYLNTILQRNFSYLEKREIRRINIEKINKTEKLLILLHNNQKIKPVFLKLDITELHDVMEVIHEKFK